MMSLPDRPGPQRFVDSIEVSFVVAAHDVAPFVAEAVGSALAQTDCRIEVLVIDDGSTDETAAIVGRLAETDPRVRLLRHAVAQGAAGARNLGLAHASGEWVAVLDGDDAILPGRTRALLDLAAVLGADMVADNILRFGEGLDGEAPMMPIGRQPHAFIMEAAAFIFANRVLRPGPNFGYLKPMFRRRFLADRALSYDVSLAIGEDYALCLRALLAGARYALTSEAFYRYRVRVGSLSWRLSLGDVEAMSAAFAALEPDLLDSGCPETLMAGRRYMAALERAGSILRVVDAAQGRRGLDAVRAALRRPDTWSFVAPVALRLAGRALTRRRSEARA